MAKMVLKTTNLTLNSVDWSGRVAKVELVAEVEEKDVSTFASSGWMEYLGGMASGTLGVTWRNDYADDNLDELAWALFGTVTTFLTKPTSAAVGTSNPSYSGSVLVKSWAPISGSLGDVAGHDTSWPTSGAITRAVA